MIRYWLGFLAVVAAWGQAQPATDWLTFGGDAARTGWARGERFLSKDTVSRLELKWKAQLGNLPKEMHSLTAPLVVENLATPRGFKDLVLVAGSSDNLYAIDVDTGKVFWQKSFTVDVKPKSAGSWLCPNALNATPVIDKQSKTVYLVTSDGKLRGLNYVNGEDRFAPVPFVTPFSKNWSLNLVDGVIYTTISQGCGSARSGVSAIDVRDPAKPVKHFYVSIGGGAGIWGRAGAAVGPDGRVYTETGDGVYDPVASKFADTVLALTAKDLKLADYYTPSNREYITKKDLDMGCIGPVFFPFQKWQLVAASGKEGAIYLLDAASLGGSDHRTPLFRARYSNDDVDFAGRGVWGAMSTWEDPEGRRWLYAPTWGPPSASAPKFQHSYGPSPNGSIMGFEVALQNNKPALVPVWNSRDFNVPEPVVIAGGVVFALSNGENSRQSRDDGTLMSSADRIKTAGKAVLYALDAATGKELYSSRDTIDSWTHFSGLAVAYGRIYVSTFDSRVYCFGLKE